ncbi:hypothetical protein PhCBS80983_g04612 [Powellomyces hirtus]|uniref:Phosphodiesterase n=1 Tax=Powellomyces hirtus TaxID=109895 RepID=A0A507DZE1_9FUNG|nr:hypothetical protein PhCBS80983_g04612 [Powellomyces hirtus]
MDTINVPGYRGLELIHYNSRTSLVIQRGHRLAKPDETVICKGNTYYDEDEIIKLKHEFELLNLIHSNLKDIGRVRTGPRSTSSANNDSAVPGSNAALSPAATSYSRTKGGENRNSTGLPPVKEESKGEQGCQTPAPQPPAGPRPTMTSGRRPRSTSLSHDSIQGCLDERIIRPLSLEEYNGQYVLILEDYKGVSLREFALGKPTNTPPDNQSAQDTDPSLATSGFAAPTPAAQKSAPSTSTILPPRTRQIGLDDFLCIAVQLAEALEIVHAAQVMHKDINPDNIVVKRIGGQIGVQLIDFNLAEVTDMGSQGQRNYLEGTLAYLSPEQTGRMQRVVDYRTDFYSLGLTLWEVLVGAPPFQFDDATEYVHAHLAKEIESPRVHDPLIPQAFSDVIDKLASKAPEYRYQSASGLRYDLMQCLHHLQRARAEQNINRLSDAAVAEAFSNFKLQVGARDHSPHINVPDKLYGRERETQELTTAYENIAVGKSRSELCLVCGSSGEGKSSLINHLRKHVMGQRGFFVHGQYTQYNRDRPYGGLVQALDMLIRQLLGEPAHVLEKWQNELTTALGAAYMAIVTDVLPNLEMIVGPQENLDSTRIDSTSAEQNTFIRAMQALIGCFAKAEHPLVVFLDDLQYAEPASQKLLQTVLFDKKIAHLLIVATQPHADGALSNAYGPTVQRIQFEAPQRLRRIELGPLPMAGLREMLADTLKPAAEDIDLLAQLLYRKTMGNPFHIREFLRYAEQSSLIYFDDIAAGWAWDIQELDRQTVLSESVADLLLTRLRQFPADTQTLLQQAACIGDTFDLRLLSFLADQSIVQVATHLWAAVKEGFLLPQSHDASLFRTVSALSRSSSGSLGSHNTTSRHGHRSSLSLVNRSIGGMVMSYKFCHSRLHQSCYDMIEESRRKALHLQIARLVRRNLSEEEMHDNVFVLVIQYNKVLDLLTDDEERVYVAQLNYEAAMRVKRSGTHSAARRMLDTALSLVEPSDPVAKAAAWDAHYDLLFNIKKAIAQVCIVESAYDQANVVLKDLSHRARSITDQLTATSILVSSCYIQGLFNDILEMGMKELEVFNIRAPETEGHADMLAKEEWALLESILGNTSVEEIAGSLKIGEVTTRMLETVLIFVGGAASSLGRFSLAQYFYMKGCLLALQNGLGAQSAVLFSHVLRTYTAAEGGPQFARMRWIARLVFQLLEKAPPEIQSRARLGLMLNGYVYVSSFREFEDNVEKCIIAGMESAHYSVIIYAMCAWPGILLSYGRPVSAWKDWETRYRQFMEQFKGYFLNVWKGTMAELEAIANGGMCVLQNRDVMATGMSRAQVYYYRLVNAFLYDREDKRALLEQYMNDDTMNAYIGLPRFIDVYVFQALIAASEYNLPDQNKERLMQEMDEAYKKVKMFSSEPPEEIKCKFLIIAAERCRISGDADGARQNYDSALDVAHEHGFRFHEAVITELYGKFWLELGSRRLARSCLHDAYMLWHSWGSEGKCKHLQAKYPDVVDLVVLSKGSPGSRYSHSLGTTQRSSGTEAQDSNSIDLDLTTVLKATQSLSNETSLEILLTKIIKFVMENAGAEKGLLVLQHEGKLLIEALGIIGEGGEERHQVLQQIPIEEAKAEEGGPLSIIYYVYRTREPLVLVEAVQDETYGKDPYISKRGTKSTLCCPIMHQNTVTGVVYLENDLQCGAFTGDRLELIQSLMAAASMSIENAKLSKTNTELTAALRDSSTKAGPRYNLDGPIKKTIDMLQSFKFRLPPGDPGIIQIDFIMKALTSTDFFSSNIDAINDETGKGLDSDTKNWIENSLLQRESRPTRSRLDSKDLMIAIKGPNTSGAPVGSTAPSVTASGDDPTVRPIARPTQEIPLLNMTRVNALLAQSTTLDFNIYDLAEATNGRPLYFLGVHLLEHWGLLQHFSLDETKLRLFFEQIEASYHPLPYHNSTHGADVLQTVNMLLLSDPKMAANFTKLEVFSACIASAVHDVDHPGLNNNFLVQSSHPLAIFYNDMSVLEFHHAAKAFEIAKRPETNVFDGLTNEQYRESRKLIISMVVATDMSQHFHYINKLKGKIAASALNWEESSDRGLILECAIKCADLNNSAKPLEQSRKWAFQVMQEFFLQGDRERKLGMPVSKFMDRYDTHIPKCQIGFIDILVTPLFDSWGQCIQTPFSRKCMEMIALNRSHWESILDKPDATPVFPAPPEDEREDFQITAPSTPPFTPQPRGTPPIGEDGASSGGAGGAGDLVAAKAAGMGFIGKRDPVGRRMSSPHVFRTGMGPPTTQQHPNSVSGVLRQGESSPGPPPAPLARLQKSSSGGSVTSWTSDHSHHYYNTYHAPPLTPPNTAPWDKAYTADSASRALSGRRRSIAGTGSTLSSSDYAGSGPSSPHLTPSSSAAITAAKTGGKVFLPALSSVPRSSVTTSATPSDEDKTPVRSRAPSETRNSNSAAAAAANRSTGVASS